MERHGTTSMFAHDDGPAVIHVCQGPPLCDLQDGAAIAAQVAGCWWCRRITMHDDRRATISEPGRA